MPALSRNPADAAPRGEGLFSAHGLGLTAYRLNAGMTDGGNGANHTKKGPSFPTAPALRWMGGDFYQCAASGGGAALGFWIRIVMKIRLPNNSVSAKNTSAKANIHACCETMPTSFLIATDAPSSP